MSLSKLESLPNEILMDLLENYINPIDVFIIFANHLNNRFTLLVHQCQLFHLDLTNIRKKDFNRCIKNLSNCRNKIQSLSLSDYLPGQMNIFLSLFPTFDLFQQLSKLYLYFDSTIFDTNLILPALYSLSKTKIHTLSIKFIRGKQSFISLMDNCVRLFCLPTIRRLILDVSSYSHYWNLENLTICYIEHLTIIGGGFTWNNFKKILTCGIHLSYLNIRVTANLHHYYASNNDVNLHIQPLTKLHTLIFHCYESQGPIEIQLLISFLKQMPNLHRLEIFDIKHEHVDGTTWQTFLETSLPLLTHFTLTIYNYFIPADFRDERRINSFQTPFWINHENFHIYRAVCQWNNYREFNLFRYPIQIIRNNNNQNTLNIWTLPLRSIDNNNSSALTMITRLSIRQDFPIPSIEYRLNNIKDLEISSINSSLFQWMNKSIDFLKITKLITLHVKENFDMIILLISRMENLTVLIIDFNQLIDQHIEPKKFMKRLDISFEQHSFREKDIVFIANIFPTLEHIQINTTDLNNVPLLKNYLLNLITLTFTIIDSDFNDEEWEIKFRNQVKFQYQHRDKYIIIWLDQDTFDDPFWKSNLNYRYKSIFWRKIKGLTNKFIQS